MMAGWDNSWKTKRNYNTGIGSLWVPAERVHKPARSNLAVDMSLDNARFPLLLLDLTGKFDKVASGFSPIPFN